MAVGLDDPQCQQYQAEPGRAEGGRASGVVRVVHFDHGGAVSGGGSAAGPDRGEAACGAGVSRDELPVRAADAGETGGVAAVWRDPAVSVAGEGWRGGGFLHRVGGAGRGDDQFFRIDGGLYAAARAGATDLPAGRHIAICGDAELDEGNIYEALLEGWKHDVRNVWWIVDYNRQSLDCVVPDRLFGRIEGLFRDMGWNCVTIKYGRLLEAAFARDGGEALRDWIDDCPNSLYAALTFQGGAAWRQTLLAISAGRRLGRSSMS